MADYPLDSVPDRKPLTMPAPGEKSTPETLFDVLVIGAGPTGLSCAIETQKAGLRVVLVDKGCVCNSLFHYPSHMTFFTTSELLEIGDIPFPSPHAKPTRNEALEYYRQVAAHYELDVRQYQRVQRIEGSDGNFTAHLADRFGRPGTLHARKLIVSTGYYDIPNLLNIPGENLSKVHHYYDDPHPYFGTDVVVIGGKNSAAIAALELWRHGARVTLIHRGPEMHRHVKYWIKPDIENRIKNGEIRALFNSQRGRDHARHGERRHSRRHAKSCPTISSSRSPVTGPTSVSLRALACISRGPTACPPAIPKPSAAMSPAFSSPALSWPGHAPTKSLLKMAASTASRSPVLLRRRSGC